MSSRRTTGDLTVRTRDIVGNLAVRKMCGRVTREDHRPIMRHTLIAWRESRGFPEPLDAPRAGAELWDAREVRAWLREQAADPRDRSAKSRLTAAQAHEIRERAMAGELGSHLAREFGVSTSTVSRIYTGERWLEGQGT